MPAPVVRIDMPARAEGVGVVRQALVGVADSLALDGTVLSDAKMAVTEACTNSVVHAYPDAADGRLDVELSDDPVAAVWQLAGIAPIGPMDQVSLLGAGSVSELLEGVIESTAATAESFSAPWPELD